MSQAVTRYQEKMEDMLWEARQAARAMNTLSLMTTDWTAGGLPPSLSLEESVHDALWIVRKLSDYQCTVLETLEERMKDVTAIKPDSPEASLEQGKDGAGMALN